MESTAKERLKALRKEAYRKAKEKRNSDPRYLEINKRKSPWNLPQEDAEISGKKSCR